MDTPSIPTSTLVAALALVISFASFVRSLPSAKQRREQHRVMRILSVTGLVMWDQVHTVLVNHKRGVVVHPYFFPSMRDSALRLLKAMEDAVASGLWDAIITRRPHSLAMYTAFSAALRYAAVGEGDNHNAWLDDHLTTGMVRLIDACADYERGKDKALFVALNDTRRAQGTRDLAWTYLERPPT